MEPLISTGTAKIPVLFNLLIKTFDENNDKVWESSYINLPGIKCSRIPSLITFHFNKEKSVQE